MSPKPRTGKAQIQTIGGENDAEPWPQRSRWLTLLSAALLLALFAALSIWEMTCDSVTIGKRVYLPVGFPNVPNLVGRDKGYMVYHGFSKYFLLPDAYNFLADSF